MIVTAGDVVTVHWIDEEDGTPDSQEGTVTGIHDDGEHFWLRYVMDGHTYISSWALSSLAPIDKEAGNG